MDISSVNPNAFGQALAAGPRAGPAAPGSPAPVQAAPSAPAAAPAQSAALRVESSSQQLQQAVQAVNRRLSASTALEFRIDETTGRTVVKVLDSESGELIRQIPPESMLAIAAAIDEFQKGLLLKQQA